MKNIIALTLLCAVTGLGISQVVAADSKPASPPAKEKKGEMAAPGKTRAVPYRGAVTAIDELARTVKVGERVFQVTSETKIMKGEKAATLGDVKVGDLVTGQYRTVDGKLEAASLYVRPAGKPVEKKGKADDKKK